MRFLLVEAGQAAVRGDDQLQRAYRSLAAKKSRAVAKVMVARRLAVEVVLDASQWMDVCGAGTSCG